MKQEVSFLSFLGAILPRQLAHVNVWFWAESEMNNGFVLFFSANISNFFQSQTVYLTGWQINILVISTEF